jgi:hypothetical protein
MKVNCLYVHVRLYSKVLELCYVGLYFFLEQEGFLEFVVLTLSPAVCCKLYLYVLRINSSFLSLGNYLQMEDMECCYVCLTLHILFHEQI